ncbi:hypothetical protein CGCS363_v008461 [Colletotrichum siamense]|uniref:uncharacterized protein n=1 Tax=Colletotrichum siamense TaxID=690259 RepID=UPI0018724B86|nr:uncharacterized protein CGCS363_v008461 [Colletotrichum siamense]KAF5497388.1 hypothetical protein CGCS363_v008461 [Colletotrichum siamense]
MRIELKQPRNCEQDVDPAIPIRRLQVDRCKLVVATADDTQPKLEGASRTTLERLGRGAWPRRQHFCAFQYPFATGHC